MISLPTRQMLWELIPKALVGFGSGSTNLDGKFNAYRTESTTAKRGVAEKKSKMQTNPMSLPPSEAAARINRQYLWDSQKVDEDSFKKDGITFAVG
jgi:hypothetical protein